MPSKLLGNGALPNTFVPTEFPLICVPVTFGPTTRMPFCPFPETTFPPIWVFVALKICMPLSAFAMELVPLPLVPMKLRRTRCADAVPTELKIDTPFAPLPEMMFRAESTSPPIVLFVPSLIATPFPVFATAVVDSGSVPIRLPCTSVLLMPTSWMPALMFPDTTFPAPAAVPPIVLPSAPLSSEIPARALPMAAAPSLRVPM